MGNPQERSLAWLAGILDGEGSISVQVFTQKDGRVRLTPFVCVVNSDKGIIDEVMRLFTILTEDAKSGKPRICGHVGTNKDCLTIRVDGAPCCRAILEPLLPYLVSEQKKRNADVVLEYIAGRDRELLFIRDEKGRLIRRGYTVAEINLISSIRTHKLAKSSEAICQAPNIVG